MTNQIKNNIPTIIKTGFVMGAGIAAGRQLPQSAKGSVDSLAVQTNHARSLQQITIPATPAVVTPASPPPPAPPPPAAPAASGYYDILAGSSLCGAVLPDQNLYGACQENIGDTLNRVSLLASQGCGTFMLDLYQPDVLDTAAYNATTMANIQKVVTLAQGLGMKVLIGPSKDDATMTNRTPTSTTTGLLVALANQFANNTNVGLNAGGLPHNEDGSQTAAIAQTYGEISTAVRATGYKGLLTFVAPQNDGRNVSHFVPAQNRIQDANMRFLMYPYSGGNTTQALSWLQPCAGQLPCAVVTGLQVNNTLGINNNINQVGAELNFTRSNNIPSFLTPFAGNAVLSSQGEQVMLNGDTCVTPGAALSVSPAGKSVLNLQKGIAG